MRPFIADWRGWLPFAALPLFMFIALIALGGDRGYLYRQENIHNWNTAKTLAIAENLSPERNFRLATRAWRDDDGDIQYLHYGRFPVGGFALVKLAISPFGDDLAAKLFAARILALLMFCGAAALAHLSASRITGSRPVSLAAVALAFSGLYAVYYADEVSNESVMDLFGAALVFHGMAVFVQEGRFRQLAVKTCVALLLGWRVYALLLPFIALGFGGEAVALLRAAVSDNGKSGVLSRARSAAASLARSRYAALAAVAILFGSALLAFNLANEYAAYGGERTFADLPSVKSALRRSGQTERYAGSPAYEWDGFLKRQLYRAGTASAPYALVRAGGYDFPATETDEVALAPTVFGAAAALAALGAVAFARRRRLLTATAVLFGFCWAIPMRGQSYDPNHPFEALPYIWLALALFAAALIGARRLLGERGGDVAAIAAAAIAPPIFAMSVFLAGQIDKDPREAELQKTRMEELSAIREMTRGNRVFLFPQDTPQSRQKYDYWLAGSYMEIKPDGAGGCDPNVKDFVVSGYRVEIPNLLTPDNGFAFLYESLSPLELCRAERRRIESSEPAARAAFDVYLQDGAVSYLKAPCERRDYETPFYFYAHPVDLDDLPPRFRRAGFFPRWEAVEIKRLGGVFDGACLMTLRLPTYPIASVQTGQWLPGVERLWEVFINPPPSAEALAFYEKAYQDAAASGEPAARAGGFDLYLNRDRDTLSYLKAPCAESDARGRFFLSVHPVNVADLPAARREVGHESLNFTFAPPAGMIFNGKCMATRRLPDYDIARIETGQWVPGGERVWGAEVVVGR